MMQTSPKGEDGQEVVFFDDGRLYAVTLGRFIELMVDAGPNDPAVIFRVVSDTPPDENGLFARKIELHLIPNGQVKEMIERFEVAGVQYILKRLIENGLIK